MNNQESFAYLRDKLPIPLLVGPRSSIRLNGVDVSEAPVKLNDKGTLDPHQLGRAQDLLDLSGKEKLGITLTISPPTPENSKAGFSLGNSLRNLWYMVTGRWSEVKAMRQELGAMQKQEPGKFVLAAGFSDPSFMGVKDLKAAIQKTSQLSSDVLAKDQVTAIKSPNFRIHMTYDQYRAENPEKAAAQKPSKMEKFGAAFNEKGLRFMDNFIAKPVSFGVAAAASAVKAIFGMAATVVSGVATVATLGMWDKGREMLAASASFTGASLKTTTKYLVGIAAGMAGWGLSFSPKDSGTRQLSEKLDNWLQRDYFVTKGEVMVGFQHKVGAKNLLTLGVGNNGAQSFKNERGQTVTFQEQQVKALRTVLKDKYKRLISREEYNRLHDQIIPLTDFVAVYRGDPMADVMLMSFERAGLHVATRDVMQPFLGVKYENAYFHSAGGAPGYEYSDQILADHKAFIGSAGMHDGWYDKIQGDKIQNRGDIIPNIGPYVTGERIGAKVAMRFGGKKGEDGGIIQRQVEETEKPRWWKLWELGNNHNIADYFIQDQLDRMRMLSSEPRGISVKDPEFERKLNEKVYGVNR
jgi:hypothetical protein